MSEEQVVLVDKDNNQIGTKDKLQVHKDGDLHRAFSVFVFDSNANLLIQRRAFSKYHSGGLWSNTVCSHPHPGEDINEAAHRRLQEEMGFDCPLECIGSIVYRAIMPNDLIEHEHDSIFVGYYDGLVNPDGMEIIDYEWTSLSTLLSDMMIRQDLYTYWFKQIIGKFLDVYSAQLVISFKSRQEFIDDLIVSLSEVDSNPDDWAHIVELDELQSIIADIDGYTDTEAQCAFLSFDFENRVTMFEMANLFRECRPQWFESHLIHILAWAT